MERMHENIKRNERSSSWAENFLITDPRKVSRIPARGMKKLQKRVRTSEEKKKNEKGGGEWEKYFGLNFLFPLSKKGGGAARQFKQKR